MKRTLKWFIALALITGLICCLSAIASAETTWELVNGTVTITGDGETGTRPNTIQSNEIEKVIIENGVTKISNSAFSGCANLTEATIPDSVTYIDNSAFSSTGLTSIEIPSPFAYISNTAFSGCNALQSIKIPGINRDAIERLKGNGYEAKLSYTKTPMDTGLFTMSCDILVNEFTGSAIEPGVTVKHDNFKLISGTDYVVTCANNINVGTATVTATGTGFVEGSLQKTFQITPVDIADIFYCTISDIIENQVYTGEEIKPALIVTFLTTGNALTEGTDFTVTYESNILP